MYGREVVPSTSECDGVVQTITRRFPFKRYSFIANLWVVEPLPMKGYKVLNLEDRVPCFTIAFGLHSFVYLMLDLSSSGRPPHEWWAPLLQHTCLQVCIVCKRHCTRHANVIACLYVRDCLTSCMLVFTCIYTWSSMLHYKRGCHCMHAYMVVSACMHAW